VLTSEKCLKLPELTISLDHSEGDLCFVSHAHSDHAAPLHSRKPVLASEETIAIAGSKKQPHSHIGCRLIDAGHMLGAKQLVAEYDGGVFAYTGDLRLEAGLTSPPAKIPQADTVLIEGTYGSPEWKFPNRELVFLQIEKWVSQNRGSNLIFGAYEVGKAQEIVAFLNKYCSIVPLVTPRMDKICSIYEKFGVKLGRVNIESLEGQEMLSHGFVALLPHNRVNFSLASTMKSAYGRDAKTALVTGWALREQFPVDRAFPLSDHVDFEGIVQYLRESGAKRAVCTHGEEGVIAEHLRRAGFDAVALFELGQARQLTLLSSEMGEKAQAPAL
jgi:putative mRNA 3-end processing factor